MKKATQIRLFATQEQMLKAQSEISEAEKYQQQSSA
jgi:hypothetical protein